MSPETAKLLELKESILKDSPTAKIYLSAQADKDIADMDMIVTSTSGAGKEILDIMKVKPGCVITDVARPLDLSAEDVAAGTGAFVGKTGDLKRAQAFQEPRRQFRLADQGCLPGRESCRARRFVPARRPHLHRPRQAVAGFVIGGWRSSASS